MKIVQFAKNCKITILGPVSIHKEGYLVVINGYSQKPTLRLEGLSMVGTTIELEGEECNIYGGISVKKPQILAIICHGFALEDVLSTKFLKKQGRMLLQFYKQWRF